LRQQGKELFVEGNQLGFTVEDVTTWLEFHQRFAEAGAIPSASEITEDSSVAFDQGQFVVGRTAMAMYWSNQLEAVEAASGKTATMLRFPSIDGDATTRKAWYKASMLWSVSERTANPEAAVEFINWIINDPAAAEIELAERGIPANTEVAAAIESQLSEPQQRVLQLINDIVPELGQTPIAPPPGGGQFGSLLLRYATDMLFGNLDAATAAQGFHDELTAAIGG
jgi:multiple sugar transport system substrate-binding protein